MSATYTPSDPGIDPRDEDDISDALSRLGSHWGLFLAFGVVTVLLGVVIMIWPKATVAVIALLLGAWLIVSGIFSVIAGFSRSDEETAGRILTGVAGAISILLGVLCFRGIFQAVEILALFVGLGWLLGGLFELVAGLQAKGSAGRGVAITLGVLGIVAGLVVLVWPGISLTVLVWVSGVWLVLLGIIQVIGAFQLRSAAARLADTMSG